MNPKPKKVAVLIFSLLLVLAFAAGQLQKSVRAVVSTGSVKGLPDIAYDAQAERYLVVWQERAVSGDDRDIMARVLNRDGSPASGIVALASSGKDERFPKAAAAGPSSWTVVWTTGQAIEACSVDATGRADRFRTVVLSASGTAERPDVGAISPDGAALVVWEETGGTGLTVVKGREIRAGAEDAGGEELLIAGSPAHDLRNPSVNQSGEGSFVVWEKPVDARRVDIEGRLVPAAAPSPHALGDVVAIASDGAQNTLPSVTAFTGTGAYLVVWQRSGDHRDSDIAFANVADGEVRTSGKLTETPDVRETRPLASTIGIAGRALVTYQTSPSSRPRLREIAARTIGWGDTIASAEVALDATREGGGNPTSVPAAGADGRGLVVWDVKEGQGTGLYSKEWLAAELASVPSGLTTDGPVIALADVNVSGLVTLNGLGQADVLIFGFPDPVRTDATGAYTAGVPTGWSGTVTVSQPGFTFSPPGRTYTNLTLDMAGENYVASFVGLSEDIYEENDSLPAAAEIPLGTTHDLVLYDEDWFKILVPAEDEGKDLRVRVWGTAFPDTTSPRDLDFAVLDSSGRLLSYSLSSNSDETAFICDVVPGYYYIAQTFVGLNGTVYAIETELSDAFGLGHVTGYVTDDWGYPVEGAIVELYGAPFDWHATRPLAVTDEEGYYDIGWLPGDFTVRFNVTDFGGDGCDWTPDVNYLGQQYNWGEVVSVNSGETLTDIDAELIPGGEITGRITDGQGNAFPFAPELGNRASAHAYSSDMVRAAYAVVDGNGDYRIDRIRAGNFAIRMRNPGNIPLVNEWYDDKAHFASADPVGVEPGLMTPGIDAALEDGPWGSIQGRVTDAYANPVANLQVAILDPGGLSLWAVRTDSNGYYNHSRVPAGSWKVYFNASSLNPGANYAAQYYPGARFLDQAATVEVHEEETTFGIDAVMASAGTISGQILNNQGIVNVIAFDTASDWSLGLNVNVQFPISGPRPYTIRNLPAGTYRVLARPSQQGDRIPHWYPDATSYTAAGTVTVTAGATTSGIDITLPGGGGTVSGTVLDIDGYPIAGVPVIVQDAAKRINYSSGPSNDDGSFIVRQVPAGAVKVFYNTDASWLNYVAEYYNNKTDHAAADTVVVVEGEETTLADASLAYRTPPAVLTASLAAGEVAVPYSQQLAAAGGRPFYRWEIVGGVLPDGLTMGTGGLIAGVPTMTGTFPITVQVIDSTLPQALESDVQFLSITIGAYTGSGYTISGTVTEGGSPLAGVVLEGLPGDPVTSSTGTYVAVIDPGFWDTVTPVKPGYAFDPPFRTYALPTGNLAGQDYSGTPGYLLSGTVRVSGGMPLSGVLMAGLPVELRTGEDGTYGMMLPVGWSGTVTPVLPGFSFVPPSRTYDQLLAPTTDQDFDSTFAGGVDDLHEDNDAFGAAAVVPMGVVIPDLVLADQDWFRFDVPVEDAGKVLGIRLQATSFPNGAAEPDPDNLKDLDFGLMDSTGKLLAYSASGDVDEAVFVPNVAPGTYYIAHTYMPNPGMVYSLFVDTSDVFPVAVISGRITDLADQGIEGATVELYGLPFDWNASRPMAITDADGNYRIGFFPGAYQIQVNQRDFNQDPTDGLPDGWLPVANFLPGSYDYNKTVTLVPATPLTGVDVQLQPAGTISGRITDGQGDPLHLALATAYSDRGPASYGYTDADGNYSIRRLRTANYAVGFRPPVGSVLGHEWFDDRSSAEAMIPVAVVAGATTAGINTALEEGAYVSGRVTNTNDDPVQGVRVTAYDESGIALQSADTQADGTYLISRIPGGTVKILFNAVPCTAGNYLSEWHADKASLWEADPVPAAVGQTTEGIDAVLAPAGAITGRVTEDGDNLLHADIECFEAASGAIGRARSDAHGNYTVRNLPPGNYRVKFSYTFLWITNYPAVWYPDVQYSDMAGLVPVNAGETTLGIYGDFRDRGNTGGVSGRVTGPLGAGLAGITVAVNESGPMGSNFNRAVTDANGDYTVLNVPAGQAKIFFDADEIFTNYVSEYFNDKTDHGSADVVLVNQGLTTTGQDAVLAERPAFAITSALLPDGELGVPYFQQIDAQGGRQFYHGTLIGGALPDGLTVSAGGQISGTPTMAGTFTFTVRATDSTTPQQVATKELSITIGEYTGVGYTISGAVTAGGEPLAGVTMNGLPGSPVTNAAGGYVAIVTSGWSGTVTPSRPGYAFAPATRAYANVSADAAGQDYTASAGFLISGTVRLGGVGQAGVVMTGLPGEPWTDASGGYAVTVPAGWDGTVIPALPGFSFAPANIPYADVSADMTGQDYVSTYAGGVDDAFEDNDSYAAAATLPIGTNSGLVLRDEDWFKVYVPAGDVGKDLRVRLWGTSYPDATTRRDLDFYVLSAAGTALSLNLSGSADETAYICDVVEGWYYIGHTYVGLEGTVYSLSLDLNEDFGLGYIEGTVRDDDLDPIPGVSVELYGEPFNWDISRPLIYTDASGHFRIGYAPGPYTVQFNITNNLFPQPYEPDPNFFGEVYNSGEVITLAAGATLSGIDGQLTPGGAISGRITDESGNPLAMALAYVHAGDTIRAGVAYSDGNGNYRVDRLRTGNFAVRFRAPGGPQLATEWFDGQGAFASAMPVAVVAGETTAVVNAALGVPGAIRGRVTNGSGDPIAGVQVTAHDQAGIALQATSTDSAGNYYLGRLPTGSFKLLFNAATATSGNYVSEFYPDQRFIAGAGPVGVVAGGETTDGIDAVLEAAGTISGRVTDEGGIGLSGVGVHAFDADSDFYLTVTTNANGDYAIANLPADSYKVRFRPTAGDRAVEWWGDKAGFAEADVVVVAAGATVPGIDAELDEECGWITGRVTDGFDAGIAGVTVVAQDMARTPAYTTAVTDGDGNYRLTRLPTCQTKIFFNADIAYLNYANEYHNDKGDHGSADAVAVTVGETTANINAVLAARPALTVTTGSLPNGELGVAYSAALGAAGGRTLYRWSIESGSLPDGVTFTPLGELGGMPTMAGTFVFVVRLTDSTSPQQIVTKELSITIGEYTGVGYAVSGKITFGETPLPGVVMYGLPGAPLTNAAGGYVYVAPEGWSGTVRPSLPGYIFAPAERVYSSLSADQSGQDYSASLGFLISGTVIHGGSGLGGVTMSGLPGDPVTDAAGLYVGGVPAGWSGTVTPVLAGYAFDPADRTYANVTAAHMAEDYTATEVEPIPARVDFNNDGQEDILWRYYGAGGYNYVWYLGDSGQPGSPQSSADPQALMGTPSGPAGQGGNPMTALSAKSKKGMASVLRGQKVSKAGQKAVRAMTARTKRSASIDDPRRVGRGPLGPSRESLLDPRQIAPQASGAAISSMTEGPLSAPITLGGAEVLPVDDASWQIMGAADFDKDTHVDILWRHYGGAGENVIWLMNGTAGVGNAVLPPVPDFSWRIVGTGDFNNDTHLDILWRHYGGAGTNLIWYMNGTAVIGIAELINVSDPNWQIAGTGDFNKDGHVDVIWHYNGTEGYNVVWYLDNTAILGSADLVPVADLNWQIAGTGDYNKDGHIDILWRYYGPGGHNYIWYMNGVTSIGGGTLIPVEDVTWRIVSR